MLSNNYKPLIGEKTKEFQIENPSYSYAEFIYSVISMLTKDGVLSKNFKKSDLLEVSDEDIYTAIYKSIKRERNV